MSGVQYDVGVKKPSVLSKVNGEDLISGQMAYGRLLEDRKIVVWSLLKIPRNSNTSVSHESKIAQEEGERVVSS